MYRYVAEDRSNYEKVARTKLARVDSSKFALTCTSYFSLPELHSLPVVLTRAFPILEAMKPVGVPGYNFSPNQLRNELGGCVTITTYSQVLEDANWCSRRCLYKTIRNSKPLAVGAERSLLVCLTQVV